MPTAIVTYHFVVEVDNADDPMMVIDAVQEYVGGNKHALDNPTSVEVAQ